VHAPRCHPIVPIRDFFRRDPREDGAPIAIEPGTPAAEATVAPAPDDGARAAPPHPPSRFSPRAWIRPRDVPADLWVRCGNERCRELTYTREFEKNLRVCQKCQHHARLAARERIAQVLDEGSFREEDGGLRPGDPLGFVSAGQRYEDKLTETQRKSGLSEAIICGTGTLEEVALRIAVADFSFMGASMGSVVGEKIARAVERSIEDRLPLLAVCSSGGARMHEGIFSLMQMAKTSAALAQLAEARVPFICLLSDPTTGGVTASFAGLGDVMLAEPGALVGFAGPRVIEQITKQKLPPGTQRAEFQLEHGMVDKVVHRRDVRPTIARLLRLYGRQPAAAWKGA
jgi:acetyl-CoA carboxylase carboxyl transferase subunit beta